MPSQQIDDQAARWAAMADGRPLSGAEEAALEAWLAADSRHLGAYVRARAVAIHTERAAALGSGFDPDRFAPPPRRGLSRRVLALGGLAASLALAGGVAAWRSGRGLTTRLGETRIVALEDGSLVTLNTASRIELRYSPERRLVLLDRGEALFDVAKDAGRPFVVAAGDTEVIAVGTSFTVARLSSQPVQVVVREGVVEMREAASPLSEPVRVVANHRAVAAKNNPVEARPIAPAEVDRALAWRNGRIAFDRETLAGAAAAFSRYSETRIVIDDPAVASREVTGLYLANDPVGFAKAAALALNLKVAAERGEVRLSAP
jgi:transmembrane sensor